MKRGEEGRMKIGDELRTLAQQAQPGFFFPATPSEVPEADSPVLLIAPNVALALADVLDAADDITHYDPDLRAAFDRLEAEWERARE